MGNVLTTMLAHWSIAMLLAVLAPLGAAGNAEQLPAPDGTAISEVSVSVQLASGRTFTGVLDARTSAAELWLRCAQGGSELLRPIAWERVVSARIAGNQFTGDELHRLIVQVRQEIPADPVAPPAMANIVMIGQRNSVEPIVTPAQPMSEARRVVSLAIDARAARWDENVEPDGLLVHVYPLDADGAIVPVRGTLNVDLKAERQDQHHLQDPFLDAGHWTESVGAAEFGPSGAVYRLRFQGINPEFMPPESNRRVAWRGIVHACLAVPGQGTFEASDDMAVIRPHSSVRDHLEAITRHGDFPGYRYFSNERTDDGRH